MAMTQPQASMHIRLARGSESTRRLYAGFRSFARLRAVLARRAAARSLQGAGPEIPQRNGYHVEPPWSVPAIEPVVRAARSVRSSTDTAPLWAASEGRNLLRVPLEPRFACEPEWVALAVDPAVLAAVSRYLREVPLLAGAQLWISPFALTSPDGRPLERRYHCDWAAVRQVRVLSFVEDVTTEHGPLTVIPAARSQEVRRARRYKFGEEECTILDDQLFAHVRGDEARELTGPAGSLGFADTSRCFHQGSRVLRPGLERVMVMFQYLTVTAFKLPGGFARRSPFAALATGSHSELQRMALGAD